MRKNRSDGRMTEDRPDRSRRKRNRKINSIFVMFGCLLALVLVTYLAGVLYMWIDAEFQNNANDIAEAVAVSEQEEQTTYTQEELDAAVAEAREEASRSGQEQILAGIKAGLTAGESTVKTLRPYYPDEMVVVSNGAFHFVPINRELKLNDYTEESLNILETGELQYLENGQVVSRKGIDVSKHQGEIDWQQVAADGVEYAFIRVGLRGYGTGKLVEDEYFEQNITGALGAGIKVGVYFYSQAVNETELLEEANFVLEKIAPYRVECPVVYDVEKVSGTEGRMNSLTVEERTNLTLLFCQTIENAGYKPMIYHNMEMGALMLDLSALEEYDKWFAYYNQDFYYPYQYEIWQYTDSGTVNGIEGPVDLNISFGPLWEE
nr:glycoside hydrolase family 25 protein [uncultured Acetatifactor sp.]